MVTMSVAELREARDVPLGVSDWIVLDQTTIDLFAEATHDHQWIHVDPERAAHGPFGTTIAHGYLSLSLIPALLADLLPKAEGAVGVNYGIERIRFTAPVPSGKAVRLKAKLASSEPKGDGLLLRLNVEVELQDSARPALVGEVLYIVY